MLKRLFRIKVVTLGCQSNLMHLEEHISTISLQNMVSVQKYCQGLLIKYRTEEAWERRQENTIIFVETKTEYDLRKLHYLLLYQEDFAWCRGYFTSHIYLGCDRVKFPHSSLCGAVVLWCHSQSWKQEYSVAVSQRLVKHQSAGGSWRVVTFESFFFSYPPSVILWYQKYFIYINSWVFSHFHSFC